MVSGWGLPRTESSVVPERTYRAPGRVNLIGDHTDYNEGFVLPLAVDFDCVVRAQPREDGRVVLRSLDRAGEVDVAADGSTDPRTVDPPWGRYAAGVVRTLAERGREPAGIEATITSTIPLGGGLSSSAALEVAVALALCDAAHFSLPRSSSRRRARKRRSSPRACPAGSWTSSRRSPAAATGRC